MQKWLTGAHVVFTDEKIFTLEPILNALNDRILLPKNSKGRAEAAFIRRQMPFIFIEKEAKIDAKLLLEHIQNILKP